jgi:DNA-binding LytR/AlgR family response regulator
MKTVRVLILEDSAIDRLTLQMMLAESVSKAVQFEVIGIFQALRPLLTFLDVNEVDIIIADVYIQEKPVGLRIAEHIGHRPISLLFISSAPSDELFAQIQQKAFARFIAKPINVYTLHSTLNSICEENSQKLQYNLLDRQYLFLSGVKGQHEQVLLSNILYIESDKNYCYLFSVHKKYALKKALSTLLDEDLTALFVRIHKRFIINMAFVMLVGDSEVTLSNRSVLPVGRSYRKGLFDLYKKIG